MDLNDFFSEHKKAALAFSGGVDSAYLLSAAAACGADVLPYYVKSQFQPMFELEDAQKLTQQLGVSMRVIELDVLQFPEISGNPANRCYYCKKHIMSSIRAAAEADGYELILDGTNASDDCSDRPGMKALEEEGILSPLRLCGLTKEEIRRRSKEAGLFTWEKPAYACLATRVPTGEKITAEKLTAVEKSESFLFSLGFTDFRVRLRSRGALLQFTATQQEKAVQELDIIKKELSWLFDSIEIDEKARAESK